MLAHTVCLAQVQHQPQSSTGRKRGFSGFGVIELSIEVPGVEKEFPKLIDATHGERARKHRSLRVEGVPRRCNAGSKNFQSTPR